MLKNCFPLRNGDYILNFYLVLFYFIVENKYAGGNPVCVRPTPKWQKGIGEFFRLSPKDSEKENRIPEEAGSSGLGKAKRK